jgi:hypothetical protein
MIGQPSGSGEDLRGLLREAAVWRLLGRLFECPSSGWLDDMHALARELGDHDLTAAVEAAGNGASEGQYHSVFGPGGPAPPREATYRETLELGSLMSELAVYYHAFCYAPLLEESLDHIAVEVGFVAYLKLKEAYARAEGDDVRAGVAARAAEKFVANHLATMAEPLGRILAGSHLEYLARASRLLASRVGSAPRSGRLPMLAPVADDDEGGEFECAAH